ncbi:lysophospholipid acyltransferase 7 [Aethina tumida]|uniref:lysophospholipid acyltransferase 7 n=1 Tax=Aethina tumida TaxID=116153 RepID=UPI0021474B4E|nr:lysophospholipid acyltransferase 7 [Aethina tumida]
MNLEDIIYLALLIFTIVFGYYYRALTDPALKRNVGTAVGLFVVFMVSGVHIIHPIITTIIGALIILYVDKRKCHLVCFLFGFIYIFFFRSTAYFGIPYPPSHTNLVQMMLTLKLIGLALEVTNSHESKKKKDNSEKTDEEKYEDEFNRIDQLTFTDIFHYSFNYVGVLTGPYYKYKTYVDAIEKPYIKYDKWKVFLKEKMLFVPVFAALFLLASHYWPLSYALTDEFYNERSFLYRWWYIWPNFFIFRMRMYTGLVLSECACIVAGVGLYPTFAASKPGLGPSRNFKELKELTDPKDLEKVEYDYKTVFNISPQGADFCTTYREGMKKWNICIQYWLNVNVFKRFPYKKFRVLATVMTSAMWHGVYSGYYVCICTIPLALMVEDVWVKILHIETKHVASKPKEWLWLMYKMNMFSYQAIAFHLLEVNKIFKFYNSIYHAGLILHIILYVIGIQILKIKKRKQKHSTNNENNVAKEKVK